MFAGKALRCDCGHEVWASEDAAFVHAIRQHAWEAHGIEFSVELALDVAWSAQLMTSERDGFELDLDRVIRKEEQ
jgi:hypothetical protein